ncbi:MAG: hypothetical protein KDD44_03960, partial [Bdellovibrionales bacterium]|nr:hypothetical protein [Bdellovibrionales bacterium]
MTVSAKLEAARNRLMVEYPFFGPVLARLTFVERRVIPTLSTDTSFRVYYNQTWVRDVEDSILLGLLLQIIEQHLRQHGARRNGRNPHVWSIACLLESAGDVKTMKDVRLPRESVTPQWFEFPDGLTAEQYYQLLMRMDRIPLPFSAWKKGQEVDFDVPMYFKPTGGSEEEPPEMPLIPGSGMLGDAQSWEDAPDSLRMDPLLFAGLEGEVDQLASQRRNRGKVPDWLQRRVGVGRSRISWRSELRRFLGDAQNWGGGGSAFTYLKPSLMQPAVSSTVRLPGFELRSPRMCMVIDTSGSMQQAELRTALGEVNGVLKAMGTSEGLHVVSCDATAKDAQLVTAASRVVLEGGGGTDMAAGIRAAQALRPRPDGVIIA